MSKSKINLIYSSVKDTIKTYKNQLSNDLKDYNFMIDSSKINKQSLKYLEKYINREESILEINNILLDVNKSVLIEEGLFEYVLLYSREKRLLDSLMVCVYNDKLNDILKNLNSTSIDNTYLKNAILSENITSRSVAYLSPQDLHPQRWKEPMRKAALKKYKQENMAVTDQYPCKKCGERKATVSQSQTRSIDEPMTTFVTCVVCKNTFKF